MSIEINLLAPEDFVSLLPEMAAVYARAFSGPPYNKPAWELESFAEDARLHLERPGFRACAASQSHGRPTERLVGFAYAYRLRPEYWWYQQVQPELAKRGLGTWLQDAFELTQMAVAPEFQGRGIGGQLHDLLLEKPPYRHLLLSTLFGETNASALYRKRGWGTLLEPFQFSGVDRPYRIMGRRLTSLEED